MTHFKARNLTALLLVLVLLVSMFSTTALAAEDEHITDFAEETEIIIEEVSSEEVPEIEESSEISDAPTSGTIPGSNIQWELTDGGMLLISGSGGFVMLLNKKDPALQKEVNEALGKLMNNGEYDKIYDKWFADTNFEKEPDVKK